MLIFKSWVWLTLSLFTSTPPIIYFHSFVHGVKESPIKPTDLTWLNRNENKHMPVFSVCCQPPPPKLCGAREAGVWQHRGWSATFEDEQPLACNLKFTPPKLGWLATSRLLVLHDNRHINLVE